MTDWKARAERAESQLALRDEALKVAVEALREDRISSRVIFAENEQRGRIHAIRRDANFIAERTADALRRIEELTKA